MCIGQFVWAGVSAAWLRVGFWVLVGWWGCGWGWLVGLVSGVVGLRALVWGWWLWCGVGWCGWWGGWGSGDGCWGGGWVEGDGERFAVDFDLIEMEIVAGEQADSDETAGDGDGGFEDEGVAVDAAEGRDACNWL